MVQRWCESIPDEVTEPENQNADTRELYGIGQTAIESLLQCRKGWCQSQGPKALRKCHHARRQNAGNFPWCAPIQWIVWRIRGLRHEHGTMGAFDKVVRTDVCHDLGPRQNLRMEFGLNLPDLLFLHVRFRLGG